VQVGSSTNLTRLLETKSDAASPDEGPTLIRKKVRLLSLMAGNFANGQRNLAQDVPSAAKLFHDWPTPIVVSGFEIGIALPFPAERIEHDFAYVQDHPVAQAYRSYMKMPSDRPTWDLTAVLYAVRPDGRYFSLSELGTITVLPGCEIGWGTLQFGEASREIADNTNSADEALLPGLSHGSRTSGPTRLRSRRRLSHPRGLPSGRFS